MTPLQMECCQDQPIVISNPLMWAVFSMSTLEPFELLLFQRKAAKVIPCWVNYDVKHMSVACISLLD